MRKIVDHVPNTVCIGDVADGSIVAFKSNAEVYILTSSSDGEVVYWGFHPLRHSKVELCFAFTKATAIKQALASGVQVYAFETYEGFGNWIALTS
jgi:hypothetical protein